MGEEFRPVAPIDPTNLRPLLFLDLLPLPPSGSSTDFCDQETARRRRLDS